MAWIREGNLNLLEQFALNVIKVGDLPKHIALIMDGNRRFAVKHKVQKAEGHSKGFDKLAETEMVPAGVKEVTVYMLVRFDKLAETLKWCLHLGVKEVTVYAFSIENFKRSQEEVDCLMDLARQKFERLIDEEDKLNREGVNIRVIGNLALLPLDLQKLIARAVCMTRQNKRARLNVAFAYTARDEIAEATRNVVRGVAEEELQDNDVYPSLLQGAMYTEDSLPLDLLIRTSGEVRLSDFLLWQASHCVIHFTPKLWPDFSLWDFVWAVFQYQRAKPLLPTPCHYPLSPAASAFLSKLHNSRFSSQVALLQS